jgi:enediyne biosynthesis protein E5
VFLACFMLTDPPTSPGRYRDQVWFGALAAVTSCAAQLLGLGESYLLVGLLVGNAALAAQRWLRSARVVAGINSRQHVLGA